MTERRRLILRAKIPSREYRPLFFSRSVSRSARVRSFSGSSHAATRDRFDGYDAATAGCLVTRTRKLINVEARERGNCRWKEGRTCRASLLIRRRMFDRSTERWRLSDFSGPLVAFEIGRRTDTRDVRTPENPTSTSLMSLFVVA